MENFTEDRSVLEEEIQHTPGSLMNSRASHLDDILVGKLESAFHKHTSEVVVHDLAKIAAEYAPIDLAHAVSRLPPSVRPIIYSNLPDLKDRIEFILNTDSNTRVAVLRDISDKELIDLIVNMSADEVVFILEGISERKFRRLMDKIDPKKAASIREIKEHERNTAGRLMTNEFFAFTMDVSIGQASLIIRDNPGIELTQSVYVVKPDGELLGFVPARTLVVNPPHTRLKQVMKPVLHKIRVEDSRDEVVDMAERYGMSVIPVVDESDKLVGVINYEDILEAVEDIADNTIAQMAGTAEKVSDNDPIFKRFVARAPWLIVTLIAGIINMTIMSTFSKVEGGFLNFILFFVPLITGLSGNIGIQSSTVLVRGMATGLISFGNRNEAVMKEITIGMISGVIFGVLTGLIVFALDQFGLLTELSGRSIAVGSMVSVGLLGSCLAGVLLGVFSPLFFARFGIDPAVASGPIITACNDFLSMSIFFIISTGLSLLFF